MHGVLTGGHRSFLKSLIAITLSFLNFWSIYNFSNYKLDSTKFRQLQIVVLSVFKIIIVLLN